MVSSQYSEGKTHSTVLPDVNTQQNKIKLIQQLTMLLNKSTLVAVMAVATVVADDRQLRAVRTNGFVHAYFINRCSP